MTSRTESIWKHSEIDNISKPEKAKLVISLNLAYNYIFCIPEFIDKVNLVKKVLFNLKSGTCSFDTSIYLIRRVVSKKEINMVDDLLEIEKNKIREENYKLYLSYNN